MTEPVRRHLAIDYGARRVGLAVNDPIGRCVTPLMVAPNAGDQRVIETICKTMDDYDIAVCVVGLPLNMDGSEGEQARRTRSFMGRLRKARPEAEYHLWDERLSSFAADALMDEREDIAAKDRRGLRDRLAAMVILESFLDAHPESLHL